MKIPNTLKPFGGADIKLKANYSKPIKMAVTFIIGIAICFGLFFLIDVIWNGAFVDWFVRSYMIEDQYTLPDGTWVERTTFAWTDLKYFLLWTAIIAIIVVITTVIVVAHFYAKKKVSKTITSTSEMIHTYMNGSKEATEVFPKQYSEISACMAQIKSTMQQHEHILKEEGIRKNDLITYLAHDLKTPLTSVVAYLSMLDSHPEMPAEERAKYTQISLEKANRLGDLLKEFFESIKLNLQDIELDKVDIDLTMMLEQIADELYGVLQEKMLTCKVEAEEEILIEGDPDKLARVFDNILRNAIAYCREKSVLLIQAAKEENQVRICFENEGDTIPEESLKRIFDKFYRADASRSSSTGGAGLGLAIAKEIVELHKGQIIAESSGGKTRFIVTLPLKGGVESNEIHTHSGHSSGGRAGRRKFLHRKATGRTVE